MTHMIRMRYFVHFAELLRPFVAWQKTDEEGQHAIPFAKSA
jgi:hypothetical protein